MNYPVGLLQRILLLALALLLWVPPCLSGNEKDSIEAVLRLQFNFSHSEIAALDRGMVVAKELKSDNPAEVAVCGAVYIPVPFGFAIDKYREVETFKAGSDVQEIARFSIPPESKDLNGLTMEEDDALALRNCSPGHCAIKMSAAAMKRFRTEITWDAPGYRERVLSLMKELLIGYARTYMTGGNDSMGEYDDQAYSLSRADEFHKLLRETPSLLSDAPGLFKHLENFPRDTLPESMEFIYWQKEKFEKIKPVVSLNHVTVYGAGTSKPKTLITSKQIYANHYFEASLAQIAILQDSAREPGFYALYLSRSSFDDLRKHKLIDFSREIRRAIYQRTREQIVWAKGRIESLYRAQKDK